MATVKIARRSVAESLKAIKRTILLGCPAPEIAHMKKKENARLSGRKPLTELRSGPGPVINKLCAPAKKRKAPRGKLERQMKICLDQTNA